MKIYQIYLRNYIKKVIQGQIVQMLAMAMKKIGHITHIKKYVVLNFSMKILVMINVLLKLNLMEIKFVIY